MGLTRCYKEKTDYYNIVSAGDTLEVTSNRAQPLIESGYTVYHSKYKVDDNIYCCEAIMNVSSLTGQQTLSITATIGQASTGSSPRTMSVMVTRLSRDGAVLDRQTSSIPLSSTYSGRNIGTSITFDTTNCTYIHILLRWSIYSLDVGTLVSRIVQQ